MQLFSIICFSMAMFLLIGIAAYGVFGKASSAKARKDQREVVNGFRYVGGLFFGIILMVFFILTFGTVFFHVPSSWSKPLSIVVLVLTFGILVALMKGWARHFSGWIGYGVWNGLLMASTGHLLNNPNVPVPRSFALAFTAIALTSALACIRYTDQGYKLNIVDRLALGMWIIAFGIAVFRENYALIGFAAGCATVVLAWIYSKVLERPARHHPRARLRKTANG